MLKRIARKILRTEIEELKEKAEVFENRTYELRGELAEIKSKHENQLAEVRKEKYEEVAEKTKTEQKAQELEKENEILRKYYDLDKEPPDEIKTKIHIDLEINRLKEENLKLTAMVSRQPMVIPQPYPMYMPFGRF